METQPAILLSFSGEDRRAYMQAHPFLNGPRRAMNLALLAELPAATAIRRPAAGCEVERFSEDELGLRPDVGARLRSLLAEAGIPAAQALKRFAWKIAEIPPDTRSILDIGCGDGLELMFLRAAAPDAAITAIDWDDRLMPEIRALTGVQFQKRNFVEFLREVAETFDLVFSNHVVEHLYDPDEVLGLLRARLSPGGLMLAAFPLDGVVASLSRDLERTAGARSLLDLGELDLGHPWKTTASDASETMLAAGFHRVRLVQRQGALNTAVAGEEKELEMAERRGRRFRRLVFYPPRWIVRRLFGRHPPPFLVRLFYAFERRFWFGGNNLKNGVAPEILAIAYAKGGSA